MFLTQRQTELYSEHMPNSQEAQIIKNVSHAVFHTVYKVPPDSTIHENEQIYDGSLGNVCSSSSPCYCCGAKRPPVVINYYENLL